MEPLTASAVTHSTLIDGFALHGLSQINGISNTFVRFLDLVEPETTTNVVSEAIDPQIALDADHPALNVLINLLSLIVFEDTSDDNALDFRHAVYEGISLAFANIDWQPASQDYKNTIDSSAVDTFGTRRHYVETRRDPGAL